MANSSRKYSPGLLTLSCLSVLIVLPLLAARVPAQQDNRIRFGDDLLKALRRGQAEKIVTVLYFSMPECEWCRKTEAVTFTDRKVRSQARRFVWVKANPNFEPGLAALFRVAGVPSFLFFDSELQIIATYSGYFGPEEMTKILRDLADKAVPSESDKDSPSDLLAKLALAAATPHTEKPSQALTAVVERLAGPEPCDRQQVLESIGKLGPNNWPGLCTLLSDTRLAVRAAAAEALAVATGADLPFDPFADAGLRSRQIAAWRSWIAEKISAPGESDSKPPDEKNDLPQPHPESEDHKPPLKRSGII